MPALIPGTPPAYFLGLMLATWSTSSFWPAGVAYAQSETSAQMDEPAAYRDVVDEAVREFDAHHYEEALALFQRAHALAPNARTHRGQGLCEFEMRDYVGAIASFEAALSSTQRPLTADLRLDTEQMQERARQFSARLDLTVAPPTAEVVVDGARVQGASPYSILLEAREHELRVRAPGFVATTQLLRLKGGEQRSLKVSLETQATSASEDPHKWRRSWWLWSGIGAIVAGAAVGVGVALAQRDHAPSAYGGTANAVLGGP